MKTIIFISVAFLFTGCSAGASPPSIIEEEAEIPVTSSVVSSKSLRETYGTTRSSKLTEKFFCEGHTLDLEFESNLHKFEGEPNYSDSVSIIYDGKVVDKESVGLIGFSLGSKANFATNFRCLNDMVVGEIFKYKTIRPYAGSLVSAFYLDLETGMPLSEPRRAPK